MNTIQPCPECGAPLSEGETCLDHFHLMGFWELEHQLYAVHHLMVLCYYLQHPSLYSPAGLNAAKQLLLQFLEAGLTPQQVRQNMHTVVDSGTRTFKITGTPTSYGSYAQPVRWSITCRDVTHAGLDEYYTSVQAWAESVLKSLQDSANL